MHLSNGPDDKGVADDRLHAIVDNLHMLPTYYLYLSYSICIQTSMLNNLV